MRLLDFVETNCCGIKSFWGRWSLSARNPVVCVTNTAQASRKTWRVWKRRRICRFLFFSFQYCVDNALSGEFAKAGDKRKRIRNREYIGVSFAMSKVDREGAFVKIKNAVLPVLITTMKNRFVDYENDGRIYSAVGLMDIAWMTQRIMEKTKFRFFVSIFRSLYPLLVSTRRRS